jgi:hypothetical protein
MSLTRLIIAAPVALASVLMLSADDAQVASVPCAPSVTTRPRPPAAPTDLRILTDALLNLLAPKLMAADAGPHDYFNELSVRADCVVAYSLRDDDQVFQYTQQKYQERNVIYDPANDPDPRRQDAAKVLIPALKVSLPNQVRVPIPAVGDDSMLVTWDVWWGREFAYDKTQIGDYKAFQFASPANHIWTEIKSDFKRAQTFPSSVATAKIRAYGEIKNGELGSNVTNEHPLSPMLNEFKIMPETWTRYWAYFKPAGGGWFEFSYWMADENQMPVQVHDRLLMKPGAGATGEQFFFWEKFWFEYNTSAHGIDSGVPARVSYIRNVVMLRGVSDPTTVLARPLK